jgi:AcrR family transcriptional regulator
MGGRRSDTRERIQQVALELFAEQGYENTSLREVSDRLEITRPALYYHFKTKEDILAGVVEDLGASIDELLAWARCQPSGAETRREILHRVARLINDQCGPYIRFANVNQAAMRHRPTGRQLQKRMLALLSILVDPADGEIRQLESRLAVITLILGGFPDLFGDGLSDDNRRAVTIEVAEKLVDGLDRP